MPIVFKSKLSSAIANATFVDKTIDDNKKGILGLYKILPSDPDAVPDVQVAINDNAAEIEILKGRVDTVNHIFYFGDPLVDGTWRLIQDGTDLKVQIRIAAVWTTRDTFLP